MAERADIGFGLSFRPLHDERLDPAASCVLWTDEERARAGVVLSELHREERARPVGQLPAWAAGLLATKGQTDEICRNS